MVRDFVGFRLNLQDPSASDALATGGYDETLSAASEAGLAISLQLRPELADDLARTASRFPQLTIILDHVGSPSSPHESGMAALQNAAAAPNMMVKLSGQHGWSAAPYPHEDTWPWCLAVIDAFTIERTLWGSNWPLSGEASPYRDVVALPGLMLQVSRDELAQVMGGNARRVYPRLRGREKAVAEDSASGD